MTKTSLWLALGGFAIGSLAAQERRSEGDDQREAIVLERIEKDYVLGQMRLFVESIQAIADGLAEGNPSKAAEAAAARGLKRNADDPAFPVTLRGKLPDHWKQLGGGMRKGFDQIAQGITDGQDTPHSLKELGELMKGCVGCHASYRIVDAKP